MLLSARAKLFPFFKYFYNFGEPCFINRCLKIKRGYLKKSGISNNDVNALAIVIGFFMMYVYVFWELWIYSFSRKIKNKFTQPFINWIWIQDFAGPLNTILCYHTVNEWPFNHNVCLDHDEMNLDLNMKRCFKNNKSDVLL